MSSSWLYRLVSWFCSVLPLVPLTWIHLIVSIMHDLTYIIVSIVMLASYMQVVVTVITSGIVGYQKMKALKEKDKVEKMDDKEEEPVS